MGGHQEHDLDLGCHVNQSTRNVVISARFEFAARLCAVRIVQVQALTREPLPTKALGRAEAKIILFM